MNGKDDAFQESRKQFQPWDKTSPTTCGAEPNRFRDNDELRFSLRSLERYAPWIRHVHLVTKDQVPSWPNRAHPKITVVPHASLFLKEENLPAFNSNAIELQPHRIPNLSRRFLYLNDDVFIGAPTTPETFLLPNQAQRLFLQETPLHSKIDVGSLHDRSYAYTQQVIFQTWYRFRPRLLPAHVLQLYDRKIIREIEQIIPEEFKKTTSHRFRSTEDLVLRILYFSQVSESGPDGRHSETILVENSKDYCFAMIGKSIAEDLQHLLRIVRLQPRFFCINDDVAMEIGARLLLHALPWYLRAFFPGRSSFEV